MQSFVLSEYMKAHPEYLKRMIAAYVVGYSITEDYLKANPHLKFAERADDTGVIVSYNTEGNNRKNRIIISAFVVRGRLRFPYSLFYAAQFLRPLRAEKRPLTASEKSDSITISSAALLALSENAQ